MQLTVANGRNGLIITKISLVLLIDSVCLKITDVFKMYNG